MAQQLGDVVFKFRRGTASEWERKNPILASGEPGLVLGEGNLKVGDGRTRWNDLDYFFELGESVPGSDEEALAALFAHIQSETPHQVYDNGPSLALLYQNAKV